MLQVVIWKREALNAFCDAQFEVLEMLEKNDLQAGSMGGKCISVGWLEAQDAGIRRAGTVLSLHCPLVRLVLQSLWNVFHAGGSGALMEWTDMGYLQVSAAEARVKFGARHQGSSCTGASCSMGRPTACCRLTLR